MAKLLVLVGFTPTYRQEFGGGDVPLDRTRAALGQFARSCDVRYEDVSGDVEAYWRALDRTWLEAAETGADLVVVEHDVVVHRRVFPMFRRCLEPWCANPYDLKNVVDVALGCTRFRHELTVEHPDVIARAGELLPEINGNRRHWVRLDAKIAEILRDLDYVVHRHEPPVDHLNPRQKVYA